jgi:hypothetical protein
MYTIIANNAENKKPILCFEKNKYIYKLNKRGICPHLCFIGNGILLHVNRKNSNVSTIIYA